MRPILTMFSHTNKRFPMARPKNADPKPDPNAPAVTDPNDRDDDATGGADDDDEDEGGGDDDDEEDDGNIAERLAHVEDILHGLLLHGGEMYVGAGAHRLTLAHHIATRDA